MDYKKYKMTVGEIILYSLIGSLVIFVMVYLFYGNIFAGVIFLPANVAVIRFSRGVLNQRRIRFLKREFRDFIMSLSDSMKVGYSVENSLKECQRELSMLYGQDSIMVRELKGMIKKVEINIKTETIFKEFADRTDVEEIALFAQVFDTAKRTGGQLNTLMKLVADSINDSFVIEDEIETAISEKKMELMIMDIVPPGIILYLKLTTPELADILYSTIMGNVIMTVCLFVYVVALFLGYQITNRRTFL